MTEPGAPAPPDADAFGHIVTLFKALADPTRLRIVGLVADRELCGQELAAALGVAGPTVTHHVALLKRAGLIAETRRAPYSYYRLNLAALQRALKAVAGRERVQAFADGPALASEEKRVLNAFFDGPRLTAIPAQFRKRQIVFEEVLRRLPARPHYAERDLNRLIEEIHADYCLIRRTFVDEGYMRRDRGTYRLTEKGRTVQGAGASGDALDGRRDRD